MDRYDWASACTVLRVAVRLWKSSLLLRTLGAAALRAGNNELAVRSLVEALSLSPDSARGHVLLANAYMGLEYPIAARKCLETSLQLLPGYAQAHIGLGRLSALGGDRQQAIADLREAIKCSQSRRTAALATNRLAQVFADECRRDDTIACSLAAISLQPDDADSHFRLAFMGYYDQAENQHHLAQIERLVADKSRGCGPRAMLHFALGRVKDRLGRCEDAFFHFTRGNRLRGIRFRPRSAVTALQGRVRVFTKDRLMFCHS
jgi:tetratricopeptide (TPR) repeat protein